MRNQIAKKFRFEHRQLQKEARELRESDIDVIPLLVQGQTVEKILEEVERLNINLIIMGSHGHGAVYHILVGSVSEGVLHKATCPVVIIPLAAKNI